MQKLHMCLAENTTTEVSGTLLHAGSEHDRAAYCPKHTRNDEMAVIENTRGYAAPAGLLGQLYANTIGAFAAWNDARVTRAALAQLSDRELEDIGLSRGDIDAVARRF
jgi:uncharacterized protein YjiS (DUF1127 family)